MRGQLDALKANYGSAEANAAEVTIEDMNQVFTGEQIDRVVDEISANLDLAVQICADAEKTRFRSAKQAAGGDA